jgi:hypothetical protein
MILQKSAGSADDAPLFDPGYLFSPAAELKPGAKFYLDEGDFLSVESYQVDLTGFALEVTPKNVDVSLAKPAFSDPLPM